MDCFGGNDGIRSIASERVYSHERSVSHVKHGRDSQSMGFAPLVLCLKPVQLMHTLFSHIFALDCAITPGQANNSLDCLLFCPFESHRFFRTNKRATIQDDCPFAWRKRWDSNPCDLAVNRISSAARYDHFDTFPCFINVLLGKWCSRRCAKSEAKRS